MNSVWNRFLVRSGSSSSRYLTNSALLRSTAWPSSQEAWVADAPFARLSNNNIRWFSDSKATGQEPTAKEESNVDLGDETAPTEEPAAVEQQPSKEEQLEAQVKELKDSLLRSLAEQENTRRIAHRDVEQARQFAIKSFAKSLLEVSDNLERAMAFVASDINKEEEPVLANLYEGIELTEREMIKAFASNGLVKFGKVGEIFDPNMHEALYEYSDPSKTSGTVGQVMKPGFMLNKRVLRPAEVGVIKKE